MPDRRTPAWTAVVAGGAVAVVAVLAVTLGWPGGTHDETGPAAVGQGAVVGPRTVQPATTLTARPTCARARHAFYPTTISVSGVTRGARVITPPRDAQGIPGVPPLTSAGKVLFAMDRAQGIRPGDPRGNVLLNAHTWPDGSALGNRLLAGLHPGDRIVVHGRDLRLCYRVTERVEVRAVDGLPRYYTKDGPPQLAILVCSGVRLGPGEWTHRTVWFASPSP